MGEDEIQTKVIGIISKQLSVATEKILLTSTIQEDLGADSLDTVEMIMELEDGLGVEFPDEALDKVSTVGDVIDYVRKAPKKA